MELKDMVANQRGGAEAHRNQRGRGEGKYLFLVQLFPVSLLMPRRKCSSWESVLHNFMEKPKMATASARRCGHGCC